MGCLPVRGGQTNQITDEQGSYKPRSERKRSAGTMLLAFHERMSSKRGTVQASGRKRPCLTYLQRDKSIAERVRRMLTVR